MWAILGNTCEHIQEKKHTNVRCVRKRFHGPVIRNSTSDQIHNIDVIKYLTEQTILWHTWELIHERSHTSVICVRRYSYIIQAGELKMHGLTHTPEKPVHCDFHCPFATPPKYFAPPSRRVQNVSPPGRCGPHLINNEPSLRHIWGHIQGKNLTDVMCVEMHLQMVV